MGRRLGLEKLSWSVPVPEEEHKIIREVISLREVYM